MTLLLPTASATPRAWNEERSRVIQETLEHHLLPAGVKWTREWIREESEDYLAKQCAQSLREVSTIVVRTRFFSNTL